MQEDKQGGSRRYCLAAFLVTSSEPCAVPRAVAVATGTKFIPARLLREDAPHGLRVHDSHAEALARRALLRWIYSQLHLALDAEEQQYRAGDQAAVTPAGGTDSAAPVASSGHQQSQQPCLFRRVPVVPSAQGPAVHGPVLDSPLAKGPSHPPPSHSPQPQPEPPTHSDPIFELLPGTTLHLYCSSCPCGNATLRRWAQAGPGGDSSLGPEADALPPHQWPSEHHLPVSFQAIKEGQVQLLVKRDPELGQGGMASRVAAGHGQGRSGHQPSGEDETPGIGAFTPGQLQRQGQGQAEGRRQQGGRGEQGQGGGQGQGQDAVAADAGSASHGSRSSTALPSRPGARSGGNDGRGAVSCGRGGLTAPGTIPAGALWPAPGAAEAAGAAGSAGAAGVAGIARETELSGMAGAGGAAKALLEAAGAASLPDPAPMAPVAILSCSDKLALWQALGVQGALLSRFLRRRLRPETITVHRKFSRPHLRRALCCRLSKWRSCQGGDTFSSPAPVPVLHAAGAPAAADCTVCTADCVEAGVKTSAAADEAARCNPAGCRATDRSKGSGDTGQPTVASGAGCGGVLHPTLLSPSTLRVFDAEGEGDEGAFGSGMAVAWWEGAEGPVRLNGRTGLLWTVEDDALEEEEEEEGGGGATGCQKQHLQEQPQGQEQEEQEGQRQEQQQGQQSQQGQRQEQQQGQRQEQQQGQQPQQGQRQGRQQGQQQREQHLQRQEQRLNKPQRQGGSQPLAQSGTAPRCITGASPLCKAALYQEYVRLCERLGLATLPPCSTGDVAAGGDDAALGGGALAAAGAAASAAYGLAADADAACEALEVATLQGACGASPLTQPAAALPSGGASNAAGCLTSAPDIPPDSNSRSAGFHCPAGRCPGAVVEPLSFAQEYELAKQLASPSYERDRQELLSSPLHFAPAEGTLGHPPGSRRRLSTGYQRKCMARRS